MGNELWAAFGAGLLTGAYLGWGWRRIVAVVRHNLGWRQREPAERLPAMRLVRRDILAGPLHVVNYDAWNVHLIKFASECAIGQRISERAVVSAGIVSGEQDYRVMARYMVRAGLWVANGPRRSRRWIDRHPRRAVGQVAEALRAGRLVLPYPVGRPPPIYPRR